MLAIYYYQPIEENFITDKLKKLVPDFNFFSKLKEKAISYQKTLERKLKKNGINAEKIKFIIAKHINRKTIRQFTEINSNVSISDTIRSIIDEFRSENLLPSLSKAVLLTLFCFIANTLIFSILTVVFGPKLAFILAAVIGGPIVEEITKIAAVKTNASGMNYIVFNAAEFASYLGRILAQGFSLPAALLIRAPALILHLLNTLIHKYYHIKGYQEGDANKYIGKSFFTGATIHGIFNFLGTLGITLQYIKGI